MQPGHAEQRTHDYPFRHGTTTGFHGVGDRDERSPAVQDRTAPKIMAFRKHVAAPTPTAATGPRMHW